MYMSLLKQLFKIGQAFRRMIDMSAFEPQHTKENTKLKTYREDTLRTDKSHMHGSLSGKLTALLWSLMVCRRQGGKSPK